MLPSGRAMTLGHGYSYQVHDRPGVQAVVYPSLQAHGAAQPRARVLHQGSRASEEIGHGHWVPGGITYSITSPTRAQVLSSQGFGHSLSPLANNVEDNLRDSRQDNDRMDRAAMWREMSGSVRKRLKSAHTYDALVLLAYSSDNEDVLEHLNQIEKDLLDTFPDNPLFRSTRETFLGLHEGERNQGVLLEPLRRVLSAYCMRNPSVGYCQATNFVAGTLLQVLKEDDAFWVLCCIIEDIVEGYYARDMTALRVDLRTLEKVTAATHPQIYDHLQRLELPLELAATRWLLSLFACVFQHSMVVEIFDELFTTGRKVLFQVALGFMTHVQSLLLECKDQREALNILNAMPMTSTGYLSRFKFSQYQLAGLDQIRVSVSAQISVEDKSPVLMQLPSLLQTESPASLQNKQDQPISPLFPSLNASSHPPALPVSPSPIPDFTIDVRVHRGANMPSVSTGHPNCYACISLMKFEQTFSAGHQDRIHSIQKLQTEVIEGSTNPTWNADMQFRSAGGDHILVVTVYHKDLHYQGNDKTLGQVKICIEEGILIKEKWYRLQDKSDSQVNAADGRPSLMKLDLLYAMTSAADPSQSEGISPSVSVGEPALQKSSPPHMSRAHSPWLPPLGLGPRQTTDKRYIDIEVTLDVKYQSAASSEDVFKYEITNDLARAVNGFPDKMQVLGVYAGSVIVVVKLLEGLCPDGRDLLQALAHLQDQVSDPQSILKQGRFTRHVIRIRMVPDAPTSPNEDNHDDLDYSITDIPLQLDEDSPSISPPSISIPFGFAAQLREPSPEPPASAFLMPPKPKSVANTLDHYDPKCLKPLTPRVDGSYRTPVGPPLIYPPKHAHVKASPHQPSSPIRGTAQHSQGRSPQQLNLQYQQRVNRQQEIASGPFIPEQGRSRSGWNPVPAKWQHRFRQQRNYHKDVRKMQREQAMEDLRQKERICSSQFTPQETMQASPVKVQASQVTVQVRNGAPPQAALRRSMPVYRQYVPANRALNPQYAQPSPISNQTNFVPAPGPVPGLQANLIQMQQLTPPGSLQSSPVPQARSFSNGGTGRRQMQTGQEHVATWLGSVPGPFSVEPKTVWAGNQGPVQPIAPRPIEPSVSEVYAGTGAVRFVPTTAGTPGRRFDSFSGHNTPIRDRSLFSPVALSAMTVPTPQVNSSLWSSWEMGIGDIPAFPPHYNPSMPYKITGPPAGAFSLGPQEIVGNSVSTPQHQIYQNVQNRGGDVVIQPSRQPMTIRVSPDNKIQGSGYNTPQRAPSGVLAGSPGHPVYFPRLPGGNDFNISVESLNVDRDLDKKLLAQARFMAQESDQHVVREATFSTGYAGPSSPNKFPYPASPGSPTYATLPGTPNRMTFLPAGHNNHIELM